MPESTLPSVVRVRPPITAVARGETAVSISFVHNAAEEAAAGSLQAAPGRRFWLVDPLDGTREFIHRNGEFTVNVALIEDGEPVLGVTV